MSLYYTQKAIYQLNREPGAWAAYRADPHAFLAAFELSADERRALRQGDVGWLYVAGVNGQLLMHFAAALGLDWDAYLRAMREGLALHGPVRSGVYTTRTRSTE